MQRCAAKQGEKHGKNKNGEVWFETQDKFENIPSFYLTWLGLVWQIQFSSIHGDNSGFDVYNAKSKNRDCTMQLWIKNNRSSTLFLMQLFWDIIEMLKLKTPEKYLQNFLALSGLQPKISN